MHLTFEVPAWRAGAQSRIVTALAIDGLRIVHPEGGPVRVSEWCRDDDEGIEMHDVSIIVFGERIHRPTGSGRGITPWRLWVTEAGADQLITVARRRGWQSVPTQDYAETDLEHIFLSGRELNLAQRAEDIHYQRKVRAAERAAQGKRPLRGSRRYAR